MELTGKVIIFKSDDEAGMWFKCIQKIKHQSFIESKEREFQSWKSRMEEDKP